MSIIYPAPETPERAEAIRKSGMEAGWNSSLDKLAAALIARVYVAHKIHKTPSVMST